MKLLLLLLVLLGGSNSFAMSFKVQMNPSPRVNVSCLPSENECLSLCDQKSECVIETNLCRDCMGSSLFMTELYRSLGRSLLPEKKLSTENILKALKEKQMMVIDRRFFLNIIEDSNSFDFKEYYSLLCDYQDKMPILFVELNKSLAPNLSNISVFCDNNQEFNLLKFQ